MPHLPYDCARCANMDCLLRVRCLRALSPGRPGYQLYAMFPGGEDCDGLIAVVKNGQPELNELDAKS